MAELLLNVKREFSILAQKAFLLFIGFLFGFMNTSPMVPAPVSFVQCVI